jgi:insulysin
LAGLNFGVSADHRGIFVIMSGYNDKLHVLAQRVLDRVKSLEVKEDRLTVFVEQLKRTWRNFFLGKPYEIAIYFGGWLLSEKQWTVQEKLQEIESKHLCSDRLRPLAYIM